MATLSPVRPRAPKPLDGTEQRALVVVRRFGTVGALFLALGSLGAGAAPVINPVQEIPVLRLFTRLPTVSLALGFSGMALMVLAWLMLGRFSRPDRARVATQGQLARTITMWVAPLLFIPPLFSRDVYSYVAQSEIVRRGMDPYVLGPAQALGIGDPLTAGVTNMWRETPAPYGPLLLKLGSWLSPIGGNNVVAGVLLQRGLALVGVILIVWALPRLAKRFGVQPVTALWLGAANPLLIFHFVAGAHNDALAIGLMVAGLELGIRRLPMRISGDSPPPLAKGELLFIGLGVVVITLGVAVKLPAVLALPFFTVMVARRWHGKLKDLALAALPMAALFGVVLTALSVGSGLGWGWIGALGTPGMIRSWISPTAEIANLDGVLGISLGLGNHTNALVPIIGGLGYLVAAVITVKFLWDSFKWRYRPMIGLGVALGALMVLQVNLQPWYLLWAVIPLAASAGTSRFRVAATIVSAVLPFLLPPTGSTFDGRSYVLPFSYVAAIVVTVLALLVVRRISPLLFSRPSPEQLTGP
ncbi:polyprenol phosphomannose-dependent alpha 1,6 mannosyltransferase MptB [Amycolatopsis sp. H20-H5]|uniref:polyprenol phosphomannose-dependent alpha 1,6 mannosyltransferase MptB n=1 Tax=Amycolatopsis sp. H20-H5 TaxID=3046309 RepID=UPI002DB6FDFF|nr:polyprenol phosphomannose-dependent alpha 1,6 mannosyltransferase MptB [Amycolatopsis sp. H20-H5]MEC3976645.1 polyprenol phosphomannose-dependent alpha 1,6 mannosyltransferase MptB [Amycolatopsis sp. H20-H5]